MDLDLAQVRAFAAVAEHRHFGRAAAELNLSQQALSKRIQRLERIIGEVLLERAPTGVSLTEAGELFLPHAQQSLAAADAATAAMRGTRRPVRVDTWGQPHPPMTRLAETMAAIPEVNIEVSNRRSLPLALRALLHGELDLAFGRVHDLERAWPPELSRQLVELSRMGVLLSGRSPLADRQALRPADLVGHRVWAPAQGSSPEFAGWWRRAAEFLDMERETGGRNIGLAQAIADINSDPARVALLPVQMVLTEEPGVAAIIPLTDPALLFGWSMIWRAGERNRDVMYLIRKLAEMSRGRAWASFRPGLDWLPQPDLEDLDGE
ncbi:LysR family transcriptional regulator [Actinospica robiniae]|uniref:LysR family transcriptional regulator n=1 Tax=Actinospica robiniae TaxID=304901 RepID=UPI0003F8E1CD|nr:LysR family transcriptional regulator [Actinospica robiniae]